MQDTFLLFGGQEITVESQFLPGAEHAERFYGTEHTRCDVHAVGSSATWSHHWDDVTLTHVGGGSAYAGRSTRTEVKVYELKPVVCRVGCSMHDPCNEDVPEQDIGSFRRFDFNTDVAQFCDQFLGSVVKIDRGVQRRQLDSHPVTSELTQEVQVIVVEHANVTNAVFDHGYPLDTPSKRKSLVDAGIVSDLPQDVLVDHARAAHLDPSGVFAGWTALATADGAGDCGLGARLDKWEE